MANLVKVIATKRGYYGGTIVEAGEPFGVPEDIWADEKRRPSWAREPGAAEAVAEVETGDDDDKPAKGKGKGKGKSKPETVQAPDADPFADAPAPVRVKNEVNEATGGTQPDWLPPSGKPAAVTD